MNATKERFKSWDNTLARVEELEAGAGDSTQMKAQITSLTAQLAAKTAEVKALRAAATGQQGAPAASRPPAAKTIDQMTSAELTIACDEAAKAGDRALSNRFYRAYSARKANRQ